MYFSCMVYDVQLFTIKLLNLIWLSILFAPDDVGVEDATSVCMEDQLRSLGILHSTDDHTSESILKLSRSKGIDLEANMSQKKVCDDPQFHINHYFITQMAVLLLFSSFNVLVHNTHYNFYD